MKTRDDSTLLHLTLTGSCVHPRVHWPHESRESYKRDPTHWWSLTSCHNIGSSDALALDPWEKRSLRKKAEQRKHRWRNTSRNTTVIQSDSPVSIRVIRWVKNMGCSIHVFPCFQLWKPMGSVRGNYNSLYTPAWRIPLNCWVFFMILFAAWTSPTMFPKNKRSNDQLGVAPSAALGAHRGDTGVSHIKSTGD